MPTFKLLIVALCTLLAAGCSQDKQAGEGDDHDHHHHGHAHEHATIGPHKGAIIEWGEHEHHLEIVFDRAAQQATVYVLDHDVTKAQPTLITGPLLKLNGVEKPIPLVASPLEGEASDKPSRYIAKDSVLAGAKPFAGAIDGSVGADHYFGSFKEEAAKASESSEKHDDHDDHDHSKDSRE
jgi:hypothetical protein